MTVYPFRYDPAESFIQQASDWIADVFYDILPDAGFEVRDEQIFMAFQLGRAYQEKRTIFAEAGVGTGKTLVYLLYTVAYARYKRKPAIIACADESLIEQLVKPEGDIAKLAKHLDLTIDARLGKSPDQYICLNKLDALRFRDEADVYREMFQSLPSFVHRSETMQKLYPYGDRKDYPDMSDEQWAKVGWDVFQDCLVCSQRHRCGQTLSRTHYRNATDIIICSHDYYLEHIWTYESRKREGQLPLLPEHSSIVFDEGHLLETAGQEALTYKLKQSLFESIIVRLLQGEVRETLAMAVEQAIEQSMILFDYLREHSAAVAGSHRKQISFTAACLREVVKFQDCLSVIEEELVFEGGMFTLDEYQLKIVEEHIEMIQHALQLFREPNSLIAWLQVEDEEPALVMMPKTVKELLRTRVFTGNLPIIFSSATLSVDGSFEYVSSSLGLSNQEYLSFSIPSPYDYDEQMKIRLYPTVEIEDRISHTLKLLQQSKGRALILFPSFEALDQFQRALESRQDEWPYRMLFEGSAEISHLISQFQHDEQSVLCAVTLWEGLDIPGQSLSHVILWDLPFPPNDPVFAAKREDASDPFAEVDLPYMLLRLKQGMGRLIRTRDDQGYLSIMGEQLHVPEIRAQVIACLPTAPEGN